METNALVAPPAGREASIDASCTRVSFAALPVVAVGTMVVGGAVTWLLSSEVPMARLGPWLGAVAVLGVARLALWSVIHAKPRTDDEVMRFVPAFTVLMALGGAAWGALAFVTGMSTSPLVVAMVLLAVTGMVATGGVSTAGTPRIVLTSTVLSLTPPVVLVLQGGSPAEKGLLLLVAGYVIGALGSLRNNHRQLRQSIALRFENQDLVERLEAEKELELAARRAAERANQDKSRFLAAASHDARQPLHALGFFVETLKAQSLDAKARRVVTKVELAQQALVSLHEGLLDLAAIDVGTVEPRPRVVRVRELLHALETESAPRARQRGLSFRAAGPDVAVTTDPALALRIVRNLVANALQYTERGRVLVAVRRRGARALVQVWDTGIGIPAEQHERIFEELYQAGNAARDRAQGLGLGLAIVRRLARALGTEVTVRSTPGRGSVFSFSLPLAPAEPKPEVATASAPTPGPRGARGQVVLLVDDDGLAREALGGMLEAWGYEVVATPSAEDALEFAAQLEQLDAVVSDLWLPGRSGHELLAELTKARPSLRRVVVSGDTDAATGERVRATGAQFLQKPVTAPALKAALEP